LCFLFIFILLLFCFVWLFVSFLRGVQFFVVVKTIIFTVFFLLTFFFSRTVTPNWDCWVNSNMLDANAYPTNGIQYFVYANGNPSTVVFPTSLPLPFYQVPLPVSAQSFQVPASSGTYTLRIQEGTCPGPACAFADFPLNANGPSAYNTSATGRILTAFDLFYLPLGVSVDLLTTSAGNPTFRHIANQGTAPRCYCVLPVVLEARISENAACWKSPPVSCVALVRPEDPQDCELCDFLSILRFDLRGLPAWTTNGWLRVAPQAPTNVPIFQLNAAISNLPNFQRTAGGVPQGGLPLTYGANQPTALYGNFNKLSVIQRSPAPPLGLQNGFQIQVTVPASTVSVIINWASTIYNTAGSPNPAGRIRVTGSSSGVVLSSQALNSGVAGTYAAASTVPLNVVAGETLTILFEGFGSVVEATPLLNALSVIGQTVAWTDVRQLNQIGNVYNNITVLRSCECDVPQQYSLTIVDNAQASKQQATRCCGKECTFPEPFTRILCLKLADRADVIAEQNACNSSQHPWSAGLRVYTAAAPPYTPPTYPNYVFNPTVPVDNWASTQYDGCGYRVLNRLTVQISTTNTGATPFRTIARQGGYDGCAVHQQCHPYTVPMCPSNGEQPLWKKKRSEVQIHGNQQFWSKKKKKFVFGGSEMEKN
jgi:hypothetical protein